MKNLTAEELAKMLDLKPHPEGGYYRETYRSAEKFGSRSCSTAIYFLLTPGNFSALHRIRSDELWHFYSGDPITVVEVTSNGAKKTTLGTDIKAGQTPQYVSPAGTWFGSYLNDGGKWALVGCTVSPGFEFADFEVGKRIELLKSFPNSKKEIEALTRE